jgi:N-acetylmuramoyl-L-alanine amidase
MDGLLLKKAAIQSVALMLAVITLSFALRQYQTVVTSASGKALESGTGIVQADVSSTITSPPVSNLVNTQTALNGVQKLISGVNQEIVSQLGSNFIMIKRPEGTDQTIKLEDIYINKSIRLTLTGLTVPYLNSDSVTRVRENDIFTGDPKYTEIKSLETNEDDGTTEEVITRDYGKDLSHGISIDTQEDKVTNGYTAQILIELDSVYAYEIYEDPNYYFISLRKPADVYDKILVIDAGHGGKDAGALSSGDRYYEKNINLAILLDLKELLDKENIKVYYTRTSDQTVFLRPRQELANAVDCDYFISIHCNANVVTSPNGTEVLYYDKEFKGVRNKDLANLLSEEISKTISLQKRGLVKKQGKEIYIMNNARVPMSLIEVGYLTNNNDMNYLSKPENQKAVAQGIYNAIMIAYKELPVKKDNDGKVADNGNMVFYD